MSFDFFRRNKEIINTIIGIIIGIGPPAVAGIVSIIPHEGKSIYLSAPYSLNPYPVLFLSQIDLPEKNKLDISKYKNYREFHQIIKNDGNKEINPEDFNEPLQVSFDKKWIIQSIKIIATGVRNEQYKKLDDNNVLINPTLLNPGDSIFVDILLNGSDSAGNSINVNENPQPSWSGHIRGVSSLKEQEIKKIDFERERKISGWGLQVNEGGWGVIFIILFVIFDEAIITFLYIKSVQNYCSTKKLIVFSCISSIVSIAAGESISTIFIPNSQYDFMDHILWDNYMCIILNYSLVAVLGLLWWKKRSTEPENTSG